MRSLASFPESGRDRGDREDREERRVRAVWKRAEGHEGSGLEVMSGSGVEWRMVFLGVAVMR